MLPQWLHLSVEGTERSPHHLFESSKHTPWYMGGYNSRCDHSLWAPGPWNIHVVYQNQKWTRSQMGLHEVICGPREHTCQRRILCSPYLHAVRVSRMRLHVASCWQQCWCNHLQDLRLGGFSSSLEKSQSCSLHSSKLARWDCTVLKSSRVIWSARSNCIANSWLCHLISTSRHVQSRLALWTLYNRSVNALCFGPLVAII